MKCELKEYNEMRSTYHYTFQSDCGESGIKNKADIGEFDINIPPFPYPEHNSAQRAVFQLHSFNICGQTEAIRARKRANIGGTALESDPNKDYSQFFVRVNGLGLSNNAMVTARACGVQAQGGFLIVNQDAGVDNDNSKVYQGVSGGRYNGPPQLCSNPVGSMLRVEVFSNESVDSTGADNAAVPIPDDNNLYSIIEFSIRLLDDKMLSGQDY